MRLPRYHILNLTLQACEAHHWCVCDRRRHHDVVIAFRTRREARDYARKLNTEQDRFDLLQEAQAAEAFDPTLSPRSHDDD